MGHLGSVITIALWSGALGALATAYLEDTRWRTLSGLAGSLVLLAGGSMTYLLIALPGASDTPGQTLVEAMVVGIVPMLIAFGLSHRAAIETSALSLQAQLVALAGTIIAGSLFGLVFDWRPVGLMVALVLGLGILAVQKLLVVLHMPLKTPLFTRWRIERPARRPGAWKRELLVFGTALSLAVLAGLWLSGRVSA